MKHFSLISLIVILLALLSCGRKDTAMDEFNVKLYEPEYASGFEILGAEGRQSSIIVTKTPWQGADSTASVRLFVARNGEKAPAGFDGQVLETPANRIVCMSSTHIAFLDAVGDTPRVVGVSGIDLVSNPYVAENRNNIADIGYDGNIDYEKMLAIDPDIVLLFGVGGASRMEPKLKELGIPYMYVSEYMEENPIGKAEWIVAVNEVTGKREEARRIFAGIPQRYNNLKKLAESLPKPSVMLNTPYGDSWVMPWNGSYVAQLIRDAGASYVFTRNSSTQSVPIDLEEAYQLAAKSDFWLNVGQIASLDELKRTYPKFSDTKPVATGEVWNSNLKVTPTGGNDYWESGVVNPDLVLRDLIMIFHPDAIKDAEFTYYKRLE